MTPEPLDNLEAEIAELEEARRILMDAQVADSWKYDTTLRAIDWWLERLTSMREHEPSLRGGTSL